jgi:hypothetical protein
MFMVPKAVSFAQKIWQSLPSGKSERMALVNWLFCGASREAPAATLQNCHVVEDWQG